MPPATPLRNPFCPFPHSQETPHSFAIPIPIHFNSLTKELEYNSSLQLQFTLIEDLGLTFVSLMETLPILIMILMTVVSLKGQMPSLQLESTLTPLTNLLKDRDYQNLYDLSLPKNEFNGKEWKPTAKLMDGITPIHYELFIRPILDDSQDPGQQFTAPGTVTISFKCQQPTTQIVLHAVELEIVDESVQVRDRHKTEEHFRITNREHVTNDSVYRIQLEKALDTEREYQLTVVFKSLVSRDRLNGLYLSNYTDPTNKQIKFMATTQFESIYARKAFPCFDEPHLKATFDVSIGRKLNYNSISNMNLLSTDPIPGLKDWVWDHFNTSMRMPTYLLAFIVSDFASETADSSLFKGKSVRIWAPKHSIESRHGVYAAKVAASVLSFYDEFFQIEYPLPKMDSVVVHFFKAGAMENWGANTYREKLLLHFGNKTTEAERYTITSVVSHELAHQNFGNLVTCARWNHLWLNEGFATYVSFLGVNQVAPEFKPSDLFYTEVTQSALKADVAAHPVVNHTDSFSAGNFDKITYKKGAALIKMMENFLGSSTLHTALRKYLKLFAFSNVVTDDLFDQLNSQAQLDGKLEPPMTIKEVMDTFTSKSGYPLVKIQRKTGINSGKLQISQEPFTPNSEFNMTHDGRLWWIPLSIKVGPNSNFQDTSPDLWLPNNVSLKEWTLPPSHRGQRDNTNTTQDDWILVNPLAAGYFRVIYDDHLTKLLQNQLQNNPDVFPPKARAQLIDDYFTAANAHYIPMETALGFTTHLHKETEHIVWTTTFLNIKKIYSLMRTGRRFGGFRKFFGTRVSSALQKLGGVDPADPSGSTKGAELLLRSHLLDWACNLEQVGCTYMAKRLLSMWMNSGFTFNPIPVDIQPVIYCTAVATSSDEVIWNFVWKQYQEAETPSDKFKLISALTCSRNPKLLNFLIEEALNSTRATISKSDATIALQRMAANTVGNGLIFSKIKRDFHSIVDHLGSSQPVAFAISALSIHWNRQDQLTQLKNFISEHSDSFGSMDKLLNSSVKVVEENVEWMSRFESNVSSWFEARVGHDS